MGLTFVADCDQCGKDRRLVARLECSSCGKVASSISRTACGLVWFAKQKIRLRGATEDEAIRWEFGTSTTPPFAGREPSHAHNRAIPLLYHVRDPRTHATAGIERGVYWSLIEGRHQRCAHCGAHLRGNSDVLSVALDRYDVTGKAQTAVIPLHDSRR